MTVVIVTWWNMRILAGQSIAARDVWAFSYRSCGSTYQRHDKSFAVRWRNVWAQVVMHWVAIAGRECFKVRAVPKCSIGVLATSALVLSTTRLVGVVRVLLAVN